MKTRTWCLFICIGLFASSGNASASEELAKKSGCLACHAIDKKMVGPSYREVAAKYRGDAGAEARLIQKLQKGGGGIWGEIFMPPMKTVPESDIRILVKWILSIK